MVFAKPPPPQRLERIDDIGPFVPFFVGRLCRLDLVVEFSERTTVETDLVDLPNEAVRRVDPSWISPSPRWWGSPCGSLPWYSLTVRR